MKKNVLIPVVAFLVCFFPFLAIAADYDGSKPLILTLISVEQCDLKEGCQKVQPEDVGLPRFLRIEFDRKRIVAAPESLGMPPSVIEHMEVVDGKLMLLGAEDGREGKRDGLGWTIAISLDTGKAVLSGSGDGLGLIIFGACLPASK